MKTLSCDLCDHEVSTGTFETWMDGLKPHYTDAHADVMSHPSKGQADMQKWMADNRQHFEDVQEA